MRRLALCLLAVLIGCSTPTKHLTKEEVVKAAAPQELKPKRDKFETSNLGKFNPKDLMTWVQHFEKWAKKYNRHIDDSRLFVQYGDISCPEDRDKGDYCVVAYCERGDLMFPVIVVDRKSWAKDDRYDKEQTFFHEMGHCILYRDHKDNKYPSGEIVSLMYYLMIDNAEYKKNRSKLLEELFTKFNDPSDIKDKDDITGSEVP